ncbi:MAG TPA: trehalose-phosphatase [Thermomicrobiales bacterium]|nr:trehalose-phosphatase [Thermomicrobiales bacterium]
MTTKPVSSIADVAAAVTATLQQHPSALLSDFDGTLSQVSPTPDTAEAAPGAGQTMADLASKLALTAIVTGRGITDVSQRLAAPGLVYVGNHGLEWLVGGEHHVHPAGQAARKVLAEALRDIDQRLRAHVSLEGVIFEDKVYSASIHYRLAPDPMAVRTILAPVMQEVATEYGFWVSEGKMVFELRPGEAVNKGSATEQLLVDHGIRSAVFLGDDVTDADAFLVLRRLRETEGISAVAVGVLTLDTAPQVIDAADYLLDGVDDVVAMLLQVNEALATSFEEKA